MGQCNDLHRGRWWFRTSRTGLSSLCGGDCKEASGDRIIRIQGHKERRVPLYPEAWERIELWLDAGAIREAGDSPPQQNLDRKAIQTSKNVLRCAAAMEQYECDNCGACCQGHLIVEVDELDVLREPRLTEADPHFAGKSTLEVLEILQEDFGKAVIIACGTERPCPFLGADKTCTIYPTRPNDCVAMQAGDEQCQTARKAAAIAPLKPNSD